MYTLVGYESSRKGGFDISSQKINCVQLFADTKMLVIFAQSTNPEKDFNFSIPISKEGKQIGDIDFKYEMIKSKLYDSATLICKQDDSFSITMKIGLSIPLTHEIKGGHIDVHLPNHFAIGHRGSGSNLAVHELLENTIPAFTKAIERGADVVEFDVQLANDKTPVIFHDFVIRRDQPY